MFTTKELYIETVCGSFPLSPHEKQNLLGGKGTRVKCLRNDGIRKGLGSTKAEEIAQFSPYSFADKNQRTKHQRSEEMLFRNQNDFFFKNLYSLRLTWVGQRHKETWTLWEKYGRTKGNTTSKSIDGDYIVLNT